MVDPKTYFCVALVTKPFISVTHFLLPCSSQSQKGKSGRVGEAGGGEGSFRGERRGSPGLKGDAFDDGGLQGDGEVVQRLQDVDVGADRGSVSEQGRVLVHPLDHRALHQQGDPLGQQAVSEGQTVERTFKHLWQDSWIY